MREFSSQFLDNQLEIDCKQVLHRARARADLDDEDCPLWCSYLGGYWWGCVHG